MNIGIWCYNFINDQGSQDSGKPGKPGKVRDFFFGLENLEKSGNFFEPTPKNFFFTKKVFIHKDFSHFRRLNLKIFSNHGGLY